MKKFTIGERIRLSRSFESEKNKEDGLVVISEALQKAKYNIIARFVYEMLVLKDRNKFKNWEKFFGKFDHEYHLMELTIIPINQCIGSSNPEMEQEFEEVKKKLDLKNRKIAAALFKRSTSLPKDTPIPLTNSLTSP